MAPRTARAMALLAVLLMVAVPATSFGSLAWGNGSPSSVEFADFGIHDITCDIALRTATYTSPELLTWMTDWYIRNETDYGYSFDSGNDLKGPTSTDNINAYTDDPDSYWKDWDNHTLNLHPRSWWDPPEGDAARRVSQLYNQTRDHIYNWLMNGSIRYDSDQHHAAYYAGLMAHYVMDITQFGHTDWTRLDHSNPPDHDPHGATYHSYYEARTWTDGALRHAHVDLMSNPLPQVERVSDPAQVVRELAEFVNGRNGPDVQFDDIDNNTVTLGSTYVLMLETFVANWDSGVSFNGARGYDGDLWNLTQDNLVAGMWNLTNLWTSVYLDAYEMFEANAADIVIERVDIWPREGVFEGQSMTFDMFIANNGSTPTGEFKVALFIDDEMGPEFNLELDVGQRRNLGGDLWVAVAGTHEIEFVADAYQIVPESNESNNGWSTEYTVLAEHHESRMTAEHSVLDIYQDDTGWFNLTIENLGNRDDVYDISITAYPGTMDFSLTLPMEDIYVPAMSNRTFRIDVATILNNPVGPRTFAVNATGGNSTVGIGLTVIIKERQLAPFIEVEYGFFTNVSVPMTFDASASWDHNEDEITFTWDFGDGTFGSGAVVEHAWQEEDVYVIILNASDGQLHRERTLEVSVEDAIPPKPQLIVTDVDFNAARFEWTVWESTRYFEEYRLYVSDVPDPDDIFSEANLYHVVELFYVDNATLRVPPGNTMYAVLVTVNINGDTYRSNVAEVVLELRTKSYLEDDPLHSAELSATSDLLSIIKLHWREWQPLIVDTDAKYVPSLISTKQADGGQPTSGIVDVGQRQEAPIYLFDDLSSGEYRLWVDYVSGDDSIRVGPILVDLNHTNWSLRLLRLPTSSSGEVGQDLSISLVLMNFGQTAGNISVDWGDGAIQDVGYILPIFSHLHLTLNHTYMEAGNYTITVNDTRLATIIWTGDDWSFWDGFSNAQIVHASAQTFAVISVAEDDDEEQTPWTDYLIAIGLILFIAVIGVLAGHVTGYYRIGSGGKRKAEPSEDEPLEEEEPEQTAEEIISELEEDLGDEDDEYLDHEPTVAELESMIPRPPDDEE